jgi:uncharacterized repeat protein (TIGR01451 family)
MKNLLTFNAGRRSRALGVPALAAGALMLLLFSLGSGQSAAMGPGVVAAPPAHGSDAPSDVGALAANDVGIVKSVSKSWVVNGDWINYTLSITNGSTAMNNVVVTDPRPTELTDVTIVGTLPYTVIGNTFELGSLAASQTGIITINGRINTGSTGRTLITNTATITATGDTITTNNTSTAVTTFWPSITRLPIIFRGTVASTVVYFDHFTNDNTGWTTAGSDDCDGEYRESDSVYRVTIDHSNRSCIVWNPSLPRQFYGTFQVKARRTSTSADMLYGIQFDTAADSTDGSGTRWALEIYPKNSSGCENKPFYWLTALKSGDLKFKNYNGDDECITEIDTDKGDWNKLAAVRNGRTIDVYIDGSGKFHEDFKDVYQFSSDEASKYGYFQMRVVSGSSVPVQVEFDYIQVLSTVTAPW